MGVHGLWDLLSPVGRRVSVETLAGKKLAIDASIWMVQFMKAMRDEKGEMVRNAHLLGFFRRICKLLYLRTKPVFVFDGGTPALKRRTVIARRRQRENAQAKIRKTAEKLLLNHLKAMRLKELAKELENQKKEQKKNDGRGKQHLDASNVENNDVVLGSHGYEKLDEMLAASIAAEEEEGGILNNCASTSAATAAGLAGEEVDSDEDEEFILPAMDGNVDPTVLAALPPSMQLDILMRQRSTVENKNNNQTLKKDIENQNEKHRNNAKSKEILSDQTDMEGSNLERDDVAAESYNQEKLDEMLAASIMAKEDGKLTKNASTSAAMIPSEEEWGDEDEEMILPHGKVDLAVLAALPPSMQLDLLVQMREKLMAENRQRYQKVKKAPEQFSELQIQAYLKTVAFRREIDQVQKAAAGRGVGGVQTSRIASEANREFIFSSSFTGDKELLTSTGVQKNGDKQGQNPIERPSSDFMNRVASIGESNGVTGLVLDESSRTIDDDVETYLDERGRIRVSRLRAMGMRMTRDLQRNLDLMKEIEQERTHSVKTASAQSVLNRNKAGSPKSVPSKKHHEKSPHGNSGETVNFNERNGQSLNNETLQISFEVDGECKNFDSDDDIFACLVAGKPVKISSADNGTSSRQSSDSTSDGDWEEGIIEGKDNSSNGVELRTQPSPRKSNINDDSEVEWEEGACDVNENSSCPAEPEKLVSRGFLEEEADLQEAIRRSLEDLGGEKLNYPKLEHEKLKTSVENAYEGVELLDQEDNIGGPNMLGKCAAQQNKSFSEILGVEKRDGADQINISQALSSPEGQLKLCESRDPDNTRMLPNKSCERHLGSNYGLSSQDENKKENLCRDVPSIESVAPLEAKEINLNVEQSSGTFVEGGGLSASAKMCSADGSHISKAVSGDLPPAILVDGERNDLVTEPSVLVTDGKTNSEAEPLCHSVEITNPSTSFMESSSRDSMNGSDVAQKLGGEKNSDDPFNEREFYVDKSAVMDDENAPVNFTEASLEKEMLILGQERMNLGDEQRKLERNAESVNSEMFAECQELLQMFGLPYIIAPMEAEAQCAYMELVNLVDGVVTDDSDVFLFGGCSVYKNIFDDRKYVETYFMKDIEKELGLTREKLIRMALLLGSDYTEGISGIGIVNAIEVVNAFPEEDGLHKFREWIESPDPTILGNFDVQTGLSAREKESKVGDNDMNCTGSDMEGTSSQNIPQAHEEKQSADHIQEMRQFFMDTHRNVSKNWHIPPSFPSEVVISAYSGPQVDRSTERFTWGKPDLHVLQRLCWEKFGWGIQKTDELLLPVLKEYNKHETQLRLEAFYTFNERFAKIRSKRIKKAVKGITGKQSLDLMDDPVEEVSKSRRKRTITGNYDDNESEKHANRTEESAPDDKCKCSEKSNAKRSRKRKTTGELILSEVENPEAKGGRRTDKVSHRNGRGRGRGRGSGRGRGRGRGRGSLGFEQSDSSSGDFKCGDDEQEVRAEQSDGPQEVRRSARSRKSVSYCVNDSEIDVVDESLDLDDKKRSDKDAVDQGLSQAQGLCRDLATSLNDKERHEVEDHSVENFCRDNLEKEKGGGFCANEGDLGQPGVSQNSNPFEANDYLKIGGGFCLDESETGKDQAAPCSMLMATVRETADSTYCSGFMEEADHGSGSVQWTSSINSEIQDGGKTNAFDNDLNTDCMNATNTGDHSKVSVPLAESAKDNNGASSVGLSAMPFLKRKRRTS